MTTICRPCEQALSDAKQSLRELLERLKSDDYGAQDLPGDVQRCLCVLSSMARKMGLPEIDEYLEELSTLFFDHLDPMMEDLK